MVVTTVGSIPRPGAGGATLWRATAIFMYLRAQSTIRRVIFLALHLFMLAPAARTPPFRSCGDAPFFCYANSRLSVFRFAHFRSGARPAYLEYGAGISGPPVRVLRLLPSLPSSTAVARILAFPRSAPGDNIRRPTRSDVNQLGERRPERCGTLKLATASPAYTARILFRAIPIRPGYRGLCRRRVLPRPRVCTPYYHNRLNYRLSVLKKR